MNARNELLAVFDQWRQLTETEGDAIKLADWPQVDACQNAKQRLQPLIIRFTGEAQAESARLGVDRSMMEREIRGVVDHLIRLEHRNGEWVSDCRRAAQGREGNLEQATRNLSRVQKSYAPPRSAVWQSYS